MVGAAEVALDAAALYVLAVALAVLFDRAFDLGVVLSSLTAVGVAAAGTLLALALAVGLDVPFPPTVVGLGTLALLLGLAYELAARERR